MSLRAILLAATTNFSMRLKLLSLIEPKKTLSKTLYYIYAAIFTIPFLVFLIIETIVMSVFYVIFKAFAITTGLIEMLVGFIVCALLLFKTTTPIQIVKIIFSPIGFLFSLLLTGLSYLFYGLSIFCSLPNFIYAIKWSIKIPIYSDVVYEFDQLYSNN